MFVAGYYLAVPGPCYTPLDRGHDQDASPYDTVPLEDLNGVSRPQGDCTDMGACETPQWRRASNDNLGGIQHVKEDSFCDHGHRAVLRFRVHCRVRD